MSDTAVFVYCSCPTFHCAGETLQCPEVAREAMLRGSFEEMLPYRLFLLRRKPRSSAVVSGTEALYPSLFPCHLPFVDCGTTDAKLVSNPALGPMLLEIWHGFHSSRFHFLLGKSAVGVVMICHVSSIAWMGRWC